MASQKTMEPTVIRAMAMEIAAITDTDTSGWWSKKVISSSSDATGTTLIIGDAEAGSATTGGVTNVVIFAGADVSTITVLKFVLLMQGHVMNMV